MEEKIKHLFKIRKARLANKSGKDNEVGEPGEGLRLRRRLFALQEEPSRGLKFDKSITINVIVPGERHQPSGGGVADSVFERMFKKRKGLEDDEE